MPSHPLENTFWTAKFLNKATNNLGNGVVYATKDKLLGGDTDFFYFGDYRISNDTLTADINVTNYSGRPSSILGTLLNFSLQLEGKLASDMMTLEGIIQNFPQVRLQVICQKRYDLGASPTEGFFCDGQQYDAQAVIVDILATAKTTIKIADNFVSKPLFDILAQKPSGTEINILTKQLEPNIKSLALAFKTQYGGLGIRISPSFHDRFIIIDDKDYYHFGASLKDAGKKTFMFSKIEDSDIIAILGAKYQKEWDTASVQV